MASVPRRPGQPSPTSSPTPGPSRALTRGEEDLGERRRRSVAGSGGPRSPSWRIGTRGRTTRCRLCPGSRSWPVRSTVATCARDVPLMAVLPTGRRTAPRGCAGARSDRDGLGVALHTQLRTATIAGRNRLLGGEAERDQRRAKQLCRSGSPCRCTRGGRNLGKSLVASGRARPAKSVDRTARQVQPARPRSRPRAAATSIKPRAHRNGPPTPRSLGTRRPARRKPAADGRPETDGIGGQLARRPARSVSVSGLGARDRRRTGLEHVPRRPSAALYGEPLAATSIRTTF